MMTNNYVLYFITDNIVCKTCVMLQQGFFSLTLTTVFVPRVSLGERETKTKKLLNTPQS